MTQSKTERVERGGRCLPLDIYFSQAEMAALNLDTIVVVNSGRNGKVIREIVGPDIKIVLWAHHLTDQPSISPLKELVNQEAFDGFALVSRWQRRE